MNLKVWMAAACVSIGMTTASFAQVTGKVTLEGKPGEIPAIDMSGNKDCAAKHADPVADPTVTANDKGELANVIVSIKKEEGQELAGEAPKEPAVLDQSGCMYSPHVLAVMTGQEVQIKNSDEFLHNVHSLAATNQAFNFAQPNKDDGKKVEPMKAPEYFRVKCDVHPWMSAYFGVFEHPYFAVTKEDGTFSIPKGLPDGEYTVQFWHEKYASDAPAEAKVTVKDGKGEVSHKFDAASAMAEPAKDGVELAAKAVNAGKEADKKCCGTECSREKLAAKVAEKK
jgi:plastocyanin